jgi:serine/threonine-protein kinase HipA
MREEEFRSCWVYDASRWRVDAAGIGDGPVLAGRYWLDESGRGRFVYGQSYLARPAAMAFDPIHLPLAPREIVSTNTLHPERIGALMDAGPDRWGYRLMALHARQPKNMVEVLLASGNRGAGCLAFSASRHHVRQRPALAFAQLEDYLLAAKKVDANEPIPSALLQLIEHGSSMGGARPKALVWHEGREWLAKLNRAGDVWPDEVRIEHATIQLVARCGIPVPETRLVTVGQHSVLLVRRFDRQGPDDSVRLGYLSAETALGFHRAVGPTDYRDQYSYMGIAKVLARFGDKNAIADCQQLYKRMVFNALIGNTDDHLRNHGFLISPGDKLRLSPAFDIVPQAGSASDMHFIGVGNDGQRATRANLLSAAAMFYLKPPEAAAVYASLENEVAAWRAWYGQYDVGEQALALLGGCVMRG